jgi:hypothetical protein
MKRLLVTSALVLAAFLLLLPGSELYYESGRGARCTSCHEMQQAYDQWHASTHRATPCGECHGNALTRDAAFHMRNAHRVYSHLKGDLPERVGFGNAFVIAISGRCESCHRQEFSAWRSGPHGSSYSRILLDTKHNTANVLMDDCLRCHGMFFERGIADLVAPISRQGPWRLLRPELETAPAIPCLTCHETHRQGEPMQKIALDARVPGRSQEIARPSLAFFDRRTQMYIPLAQLPIPAMQDNGRVVKMSHDQRQALCYQCHAPVASMQVGSGDDRTGLGVHEGISCLACHAQHGQKTRASCATCHPKMSNCGLDVETMDTTFKSADSKHNIHWVKCADCHPRGVPKQHQKNPTNVLSY